MIHHSEHKQSTAAVVVQTLTYPQNYKVIHKLCTKRL